MSKEKDNLIHVLLVDDDSALLETSKLILADMDNTIVVDSASCVDKALGMIEAKVYDVIISDYEMPLKSGLDFLKNLREKNNQTSFILFTGKGREEVAIEALNLGADRYINKQGNTETVYKELTLSIHQLHEKARAKSLLLENKGLLIENMPDAIIISDFKGNFLDGNKHLQELIGYKKEELIGRNMQQMKSVSQESISIIMKQITEVSLGKTIAPTEQVFKRKDGNDIFVQLSVFPVKRGDETVIMFIARDITEYKKADAELQQKCEILESITKSTDSGLGVISKDYDVLWINSTLQPVMQKNGGPNKKCYQIFNNLDSICPDCGIKKVFEQNLPLAVREYDYKIEENEPTQWVELRSTPLKDKKGVVIAGLELAVPITERKKAQRALKESEERYRMIAHNMQDVVFLIDTNTIFTYVSPSMSAFGYSPDELIGKNAKDFINIDDLAKFARNFPKLLKGEEIPPFEARVIAKDNTYRWIECTAKAIKDATGEDRLIVISRNIEKRKQAEQKLAVVNEKLQVVGKLTRHDVRNKLAGVSAMTYLLKKKLNKDPEVDKYSESINSAIATCNKLFEFSQLYEKIGAEEQINVDVKNCFDEAVALFPNLSSVKTNNECEGLTVVADSLLRQLFYNLIDNSLKHGKKVTQIKLHYTRESNQVKLFYEDNGVGVPAENKVKLFSEGFSTGGGTGLGLSMIRKMMEVYKWSIQEIGVPNEGIKFEITIPKQKSIDL